MITDKKGKRKKNIIISGTNDMISWPKKKKKESKKDQENRRKEVESAEGCDQSLTVQDKASLYCLMRSGIN